MTRNPMATNQNKDENYPSYILASCSVHIEDVSQFLNELATIGMKTGYHIILIRSSCIAGKKHIKTAITHAIRSFSTKPIAKRLEIEVLLFAAATRQTGQIHPFGVQKGENNCCICLIPRMNELQTNPSDLIKELRINIDIDAMMKPYFAHHSVENDKTRLSFFKKHYDITAEELAIIGENRLEDLICERVALLSLLK